MSNDTPSRRTIVAGLAAGTALACLPGSAMARDPAVRIVATTREIEVNGKLATRYALVGPDGPDGIRMRRGDDFDVRLVNRLGTETLVHWHGLILPPSQDGVPGISSPPIAAGGHADYHFPLVQAGTFWMHSHAGFQEQVGLAMPLILEDPDDPMADLQEVVLFLEDFTFRKPDEILAGLRKGDTDAAPMKPMQTAKDKGTAMGGMPGMDVDLNDVDYDAYLANSRTLRDPEVVRVDRGARVRVRIVNGAASTNFFVSTGGRSMRLVAVDGEPVEPIDGTVFPMCIAQRIDILVDVPPGEAVPILAQREGDTPRTGLILAAPGAKVAKLPEDAAGKAGRMGTELEARLRAARPLSDRPVDSEVLSSLSGDMAKYVWMMHGGVYPDNPPLTVKTGQRTAIRMRNETGMAHPMHLHGHVFQVVEIAGKPVRGAVRDTVLVPPRADIVVAFDADNPGIWAYHCHNLYHMAAGMFSYVTYVPAT